MVLKEGNMNFDDEKADYNYLFEWAKKNEFSLHVSFDDSDHSLDIQVISAADEEDYRLKNVSINTFINIYCETKGEKYR